MVQISLILSCMFISGYLLYHNEHYNSLANFSMQGNNIPLLTQSKAEELVVSRHIQLQRLAANQPSGNDGTFNEMLRFLTQLDDNCSSLLVPEALVLLNAPFTKTKNNEIQEKLVPFGNNIEGSSSDVQSQVLFYILLARQPWVRQVCEIGFNAGHSALYWLASSDKVNLLSFDIGSHDYAKVIADYMSSTFPNRFRIVWGDSTKTIPTFIEKMQTSEKMLWCDVIVIDGGHSYDVAIADLRNMRAFARSPQHLLIMDDTPCTGHWCDPARAWRDVRNIVNPLYSCTNYPNMYRGFSVGFYNMSM